ncbi:uncharacterized protein KY384_008099 [Bacidia gigantensis]|uniref:uncharacterized protein n=1 Tax=Bacidia gigantensis TaxID=2732470 RepID=UPI001D0473AE|nr:uncharacterized protein KY384_008099 [Bacidia gigantensis]KAG8526670.1 hypothetical protein KY384_008099 [Bacidia gigantensis]
MNLAMSSPNPRVILGLMTFGPDEKKGARITSVDDFNECLSHLAERGYYELDTARVYIDGAQEAFTAKAGYKDKGFSIATKCYPTPGVTSHKPEVLREKLETSLKELETDTVEIFYLHAADRSTPFEETLREVDKMHKEGKFVQLGLSNYTAFEVAEVVMTCKANGWVRPTIYQAMYNCITRSIEAELIPCCRRYGLDLVTYNPLVGGLFSGKIKAKDLVPTEGRYSDKDTKQGKNYRDRYFKDATFQALSMIEPVAKEHNLTLLEVALRWMRWHSKLEMTPPKRDGVIIGVSSFEQLKGNLDDLEKGPLPDKVVETLDQCWAVCKGTAPNYWHLDLKYTYDTVATLFPPKS